LVDRLQNGTHRGKRRRGRPVSTGKDGIRDSMQRGDLKDEECFDCELWRKKIMSLGWGKLYTYRKNSIFLYIVQEVIAGHRSCVVCFV
jgi:hypothetical protein